MKWVHQYTYPDAVLLVFASHEYDWADYIRDYNEALVLASRLTGRPVSLRQDPDRSDRHKT